MVSLRSIPGKPTAKDDAMPAQLEAYGGALWRQVMAEYDVADVGGRAMLEQACRALDRAERARAQINRDGEVVATKSGPREHPLLKSELSNRAFVVRTLSRLGLNFEPVRAVGRPLTYA
jgi:hypothetical protein